MDPNWILVIVLWGGLIGAIIVCLIPELKKTPEQRKAEAQKVRESLIKKREEAKKERQEAQQEAQNNAPAKGCLQSTVEFGFLCMFLMVTVIVCIILIIASGS